MLQRGVTGLSTDKKPGIHFIRASELFEEWQRLETLKRNSYAGIETDQGLTPAHDVQTQGDVYDNE